MNMEVDDDLEQDVAMDDSSEPGVEAKAEMEGDDDGVAGKEEEHVGRTFLCQFIRNARV